MIFQDPMSSLHPLYKVGWQIVEAIRAHEDVSKAPRAPSGRERSTGSASPNRRSALDDYPHELSGGMRQRVMIAMALVLRSGGADRRRADDGARRHRPGADPRSARRAAQRSAGRPSSSSPTTSASSPRRPTTSRSCTRAGWSSAAPVQSLFGAPAAPVHAPASSIDARGAARDAAPAPDPGPAAQPDRACRAAAPFHPRCPHAFAVCPRVEPPLLLSAPGHTVACHLAPPAARSAARSRGTVRMEEPPDDGDPLVEVAGRRQALPAATGLSSGATSAACTRWTASRSRSRAASRSASSASPDAGSPPWPR